MSALSFSPSLLAHGMVAAETCPSQTLPCEESDQSLYAPATPSASTALLTLNPQPAAAGASESAALTRSRYTSHSGSTTSINTQIILRRDVGVGVRMVKCFGSIIPVALDEGGSLQYTFNTVGVLKYRMLVGSILSTADYSLQASSYTWNTMRRLDSYITQNYDIDVEERGQLVALIDDLNNKKVRPVMQRLESAASQYKELVKTTDLFMPTSCKPFPLPEDMSGSVTLQITKLIEAHMMYSEGSKNTPDIFKILRDLITASSSYISDIEVLAEWFDDIRKGLATLSENISNRDVSPEDWRRYISNVSELSYVYFSNVPLIMQQVPKEKKHYFAHTRAILQKTKHHWHNPDSVDKFLIPPPSTWAYSDIDWDSKPIIAKTMPLPDFPVDRLVDMLAIVTFVESYPGNEYGIQIHVNSRIHNHGPSTRWLAQCDELDISVNLGQTQSAHGPKAIILSHRPTREIFDKDKCKYIVKYSGKLAPSMQGINFGDMAMERSKEGAKTEYGSTEAFQEKDDFRRWTLARDRQSHASIPDCYLGLIVLAPSPEIELEVLIIATYRAIPFK